MRDSASRTCAKKHALPESDTKPVRCSRTTCSSNSGQQWPVDALLLVQPAAAGSNCCLSTHLHPFCAPSDGVGRQQLCILPAFHPCRAKPNSIIPPIKYIPSTTAPAKNCMRPDRTTAADLLCQHQQYQQPLCRARAVRMLHWRHGQNSSKLQGGEDRTITCLSRHDLTNHTTTMT